MSHSRLFLVELLAEPMNVKTGFVLLLLILVIFSCHNMQNEKKKLNTNFQIGPIPNIEEFKIYDNTEIRMDNMAYRIGGPGPQGDFRNNRSRIYINSFKNGKINEKSYNYINPYFGKSVSIDTTIKLNEFHAAFCNCFVHKDTLLITTHPGVFGVVGFDFRFNIEISDEDFQISFIEYSDGTKLFRSESTDTILNKYAVVKSKYQYLMLDKKPTYLSNQQINGYLTYTTNEYYVRDNTNILDTIYQTGKLYFTCKTREITQGDTWIKNEPKNQQTVY